MMRISPWCCYQVITSPTKGVWADTIAFVGDWPTEHAVFNFRGQLLGRGRVGTAVVLGKLKPSIPTLRAAYQGKSLKISDNLEYVTINPTCVGRLVPYHGGMGRELPTAAVRGGVLPHGTPLYAAHAQPGEKQPSFCYYNPGIDRAVIAFGGEFIQEEMEILVVSWEYV